MTDEVKFCYKCGASLPEGADFCPECGASVKADNSDGRAEYTARPVSSRKSDLGAIPALILVYGILAIIGAFFIAMTGAFLDNMLDMFNEYVKQGVITQEEYDQLLSMLGLTSEAAISAVKFRFILEGIVLGLSGITAIISSRFCGKMENFQAAFTLCLVSSGLTVIMIFLGDLTGLFLAVVGFVMSFLIYQSKDKFIS